MNVFAIDIKPFKSEYLSYLFFLAMVIAGSYYFAGYGVRVIDNPEMETIIKSVFIFGSIAASVLVNKAQRIKLKTIVALQTFDEQVVHYIKLCRQRILWNFCIGILACILFVLTAQNIFFYFSLFDLFFLLLMFPNEFIFRKELKNDEIEFV